eukprot:TRINITY_DN7406_c0_g1_i2.p1 TRINITY_DN7406_c0_g1~~TRINITY_DN7406_c0_g1_i2.p1  ORF type:complete len:542 (-),score=97.12 TRINITY_DN7406_c0_g1_i2:74-1654(-)
MEPPIRKYILSIDTGTTNIRAIIFDQNLTIIARAVEEIPLIKPRPGWVEQDPHVVWEQCQRVIKHVLHLATLSARDVACIGIANQRGTFVTWDRRTGKPFHNFITWQDVRAAQICELRNSSMAIKGIQGVSSLAHFFTRKPRFLAASVLGINTIHVPPRLAWVLDNVPEVKQARESNDLMFGTIDTWLVHNLTSGRVHATDYSNISSTGLYDPYILGHNAVLMGIMNLPKEILPSIMDTAGSFGECSPELFGHPIPITAVCADQQAALFGECCFQRGDVKITLGTGCFVDIMTGSRPMASTHGMYPLVTWKIKDEISFALEGSSSAVGTVIDWGTGLDLYDDVSKSSDIASSVPNSCGLVFVPAFSGLSSPHNDPTARGLLIGMTSNVKKPHVVRAILESFGYRCKELIDTIRNDSQTEIRSIKADGGVSRNDFVMQFISDMVEMPIDRAEDPDMTALGACMLAGLGAGIFKDKEELSRLRKSNRIFEPSMPMSKRDRLFRKWEKALALSMHWADDDDDEIHEENA